MIRLLNLAWNDIQVFFASRSTLVFFLGLPVVFTAILGIATGGFSPEDDPRLPIALVDADGSSLAELLGDTLADSAVVRPLTMGAAQAEQALEQDEVFALIRLPAGLGAALTEGRSIEIELQLPGNDNGSLAVREAVRSAAAQTSAAVLAAQVSVEAAEAIRPFETAADRRAYIRDGIARAQTALAHPALETSVTVSGVVSSGPQFANGFEQSSPGQLVTWVLITLLGGAAMLVDERSRGTLRRLLTTPSSKAEILTGKLLGRLSLGLVQMTLLIVVGQWLFGLPYGESPLALAMVVVSFGIAATAFGLMLAAIVRTVRQANAAGMVTAQVLAALGGAWWPLEVTPAFYQQAVQVLPTTWAMRGFTDVIVRGQGPSGVLLECGVLLAFALLFLSIGVWRFRYE